jgi:hypothetical protein
MLLKNKKKQNFFACHPQEEAMGHSVGSLNAGVSVVRAFSLVSFELHFFLKNSLLEPHPTSSLLAFDAFGAEAGVLVVPRSGHAPAQRLRSC